MTLYKTNEERVSIDLNFYSIKGKLVVNKKNCDPVVRIACPLTVLGCQLIACQRSHKKLFLSCFPKHWKYKINASQNV